jgi:hypothetical protein
VANKVKIVTFSSTLMYKAKQVGKAKLAGDPEEIAKAEAALKEYEDLCLASDEMQIDIPAGWGNPRR